jgi:hypothetical protein
MTLDEVRGMIVSTRYTYGIRGLNVSINNHPPDLATGLKGYHIQRKRRDMAPLRLFFTAYPRSHDDPTERCTLTSLQQDAFLFSSLPWYHSRCPGVVPRLSRSPHPRIITAEQLYDILNKKMLVKNR